MFVQLYTDSNRTKDALTIKQNRLLFRNEIIRKRKQSFSSCFGQPLNKNLALQQWLLFFVMLLFCFFMYNLTFSSPENLQKKLFENDNKVLYQIDLEICFH